MFCNGRGKRASLVANVKRPWHRNVFVFTFVLFSIFCQNTSIVTIEEEGEKVKHEENSKNVFFGKILKNKINNASNFWCMLTSPGPRSFTPTQGPKGFKI